MSRRTAISLAGAVVLCAVLLFGRHWGDELPNGRSAAPAQMPEHSESDSGLTFHGYDCTSDCSGHEAGYQWAEQDDITNPADCDGNSQSFIEGCQAYAEEQNESNNNEDSDKPDDE